MLRTGGKIALFSDHKFGVGGLTGGGLTALWSNCPVVQLPCGLTAL